MFRNSSPELECFLSCSYVHWILKNFSFKISDGMPIDHHIHSQIGTPVNSFIEQLYILFRSAFPPCNRVNRDTDNVRTHFFHFFKMGFAPMSLTFNLIRIRNSYTPEQHFFTLRINKFVSLYLNQRKHFQFCVVLSWFSGAVLKPG